MFVVFNFEELNTKIQAFQAKSPSEMRFEDYNFILRNCSLQKLTVLQSYPA